MPDALPSHGRTAQAMAFVEVRRSSIAASSSLCRAGLEAVKQYSRGGPMGVSSVAFPAQGASNTVASAELLLRAWGDLGLSSHTSMHAEV